MTYGSVATGLGTETLAWEQSLGWQALWFSEIEPFPSAVLKHHWPHVPNLGDMCKLTKKKIFNETNPELIVGGTPCQAFSVAGLRGGLDDQRGNLSLVFCRILLRKQPKWFVWENVPGVFSSFSDEKESKKDTTNRKRKKGVKGNKTINARGRTTDADTIIQSSDFAALLTGFQECGYSCAFRVLDYKYFGVPQRRRRVFVVGHLGNDWRPPFAVLFEPESLYGNITPSRKERPGTASTTESDPSSNRGSAINETASPIATKQNSARGWNDNLVADSVSRKPYSDRGLDNNLVVDEKKWPAEQTATLDASYARLQGVSGQDQRQNFSHLVAFGGNNTKGEINVSTAIKGHNNRQDFESETFIIQDAKSLDVRNMTVNEELSATIQAKNSGGNSLSFINPIVYPAAQLTSPENRSNPKTGDPSPTLAKGGQQHIIAGESKQIQWASGGGQIENDTAQALRSKAESNYQFVKQTSPTLTKHNLDSRSPQSQEQQQIVAAVASVTSVIRRLTPVECERLQGYPDNHTNIPWNKKKTSPDTLRYQAIGNGMTKDVMEWIGTRIDKVEKIIQNNKPKKKIKSKPHI